MCGRYSSGDQTSFLEALGAEILSPATHPGMNLAPSQAGTVILREGDRLVARQMRWGLVPRFAKEIGKYATFNARSETLATSPAFRTSFRDRRCLIPCEGFYEWKVLPGQENVKRPKKQPYKFTMQNGEPFAMAGLWDRATINGEELLSYTIVTTTPNDLVAQYHHRMAVILHPQDYETWLDPKHQDTAALQRLLVPFPAHQMKAEPASV